MLPWIHEFAPYFEVNIFEHTPDLFQLMILHLLTMTLLHSFEDENHPINN